MIATNERQPEYTRLFSGLVLAAGLILLTDSISQLVQAAGALELGNRAWRVANLGLFFTQVTPIVLGLMLVGQFAVQAGGGWRLVGRSTAILGVVVLALMAIYFWDAGVLGSAVGPARRTRVQILLSGGAFALALLAAGLLALRGRRSGD